MTGVRLARNEHGAANVPAVHPTMAGRAGLTQFQPGAAGEGTMQARGEHAWIVRQSSSVVDSFFFSVDREAGIENGT